MTLWIVRHGRTESNASGLLLGRADPPLDEVGRAQAASLVATIPAPARVVSSPLQRCVATASVFGVDVEVDDRWIELDYGEWDQTPLSSLPAETWARWRTDLDLRPPGGETINELGARVRDACDDLVDAAREADVVVVTHVSPFKAAMAWALGVGDEVCWRVHVSPASVVQIAMRGDRPSLVV